jgi:hypothetical protein
MMKPLTTLRADLSALTLARMGFDGANADQGSPEWLLMRRGVITASRAKDLISKDRSGKGPGTARQSYMLELAGEILADVEDRGQFKQTQWGHEYEDEARATFELHTGFQVHAIPFIYGDASMRYGCSPDGIVDEKSGAEIKCPFTNSVYMEFLGSEEPKPEYVEQVQFSMFVTGAEFWHFCNYNPRAHERPFHAIVIERDESRMKTFADAVGQMVYDLDKYLRDACKLRTQFGDQWATASTAQIRTTAHADERAKVQDEQNARNAEMQRQQAEQDARDAETARQRLREQEHWAKERDELKAASDRLVYTVMAQERAGPEVVDHVDTNAIAVSSPDLSVITPMFVDDGKTMKLGEICERLGFNLTAQFVASLGFEPVAHVKNAKLYRANDFPAICAALVQHINQCAQLRIAAFPRSA